MLGGTSIKLFSGELLPLATKSTRSKAIHLQEQATLR